jgi:YHS domain-containing protein
MFRAFLTVVVSVLPVAAVCGQSGTKGGVFVPRRNVTGTPVDPNAPVPGERPLYAAGGHDVLSIRNSKPTLGKAEFTAVFDGQIYLFASDADRKKFAEKPQSLAPVLSGWSIVAWVNEKVLNAGSAAHSAVHKDRLYLFADSAEKAAFLADPAKFENADLLLNGTSPVALVDQEQTVAGSSEHEAVCEGWRVRFASVAEKDKFLNDLGKYYPTIAGFDPVALYTSGRVLPGDPKNAFLYKNRLYLFANAENSDRFRAEYKIFSDLDVAEGGYCPVTRVDGMKQQLGKYGITTIHLGRRLLFASEENRKKFLADPVKYMPEAKKKSPIP